MIKSILTGEKLIFHSQIKITRHIRQLSIKKVDSYNLELMRLIEEIDEVTAQIWGLSPEEMKKVKFCLLFSHEFT